MNIDTLITDFIIQFPELEVAAKKELKRWEGEEEVPHDVFFGYILNPFLEKELVSGKNKSFLQRIFSFLEVIALSQDERVRWVLSTTILEKLGDDKKILQKARSLMGSNTLRMSHEVEKYLGRE
jgi:hypothetical protein